VLVGRLGWHVEKLRDMIVSHPEYGRNLLWFDDVDDEELELAYEGCEGVIVASYAEGFGLPLIEALGHRKPVLARNIAIFRVHEDLGVSYFPHSADAGELASRIDQWICDVRGGRVTVLSPSTSWTASARVVLSAIA
jgi:glycosyltransferase involved in cell wall biosynthesis